MISEELVFGSSGDFEVLSILRLEDQLILSVQSRSKGCPCPVCHVLSSKLHSYYIRQLKDLPAFDNKVSLRLRAKKWHCLNTECPRKIFAERFQHFFKPYKRTTDRLREKLLNIALFMGGRPAEMLCKTLKIVVSSSSLIRIIHQQAVLTPSFLDAIGVDDWAFRKGVNYGTAIVDLKLHKVVDLLPDRETATLENWLKNHPEIKIITRDRFSRYALAASNGSPDAVQVADRWHLLKNMGDALQKLLERKRQQIMSLQAEQAAQGLENEQPEPRAPKQEEKPSPRYQLLQRIKEMYATGKGTKRIARILGISRNTVKKYIHLHEPPQRKGTKTTNLISFSEYLHDRIEQDPNVKTIELFLEIKAMGYNGCRSTLNDYLRKYTKQHNRTRYKKLPRVSWTTAKVKVLLCKKAEQLEEKDKKVIDDICEKSAEIHQARVLAGKFRYMMENKQGHLFNNWIEEVEQSGIQEMKGFAKGLLTDYQAVVNALSLPWSNGQVEGQINKLKTIKRQMYGRAGFELLRKRVILHSAYYHQN